jgi:hypothetical protein
LPITTVRGDIFLSRAQVLTFGSNASGAAEVTPLATDCAYCYPAAFSAFRKQVRAGRLRAGDWWLWRDAAPWLGLMVVRQHPGGATRPRYVEEAAQIIAHDWQREGINSLAIAPLGEPLEWPALRAVLDHWLGSIRLPVVVYEEHLPGVRAPEPWDA